MQQADDVAPENDIYLSQVATWSDTAITSLHNVHVFFTQGELPNFADDVVAQVSHSAPSPDA